METTNIIACVAAGAAVLSAGVTVWYAISAKAQAAESKRQADSAKSQAEAAHLQADAAKEQVGAMRLQVELGKQQLEVMQSQVAVGQETNRIAAGTLEEAREARAVRVKVLAKAIQDTTHNWWLQVFIQNDSTFPVIVQSVTVEFGDGTALSEFPYWTGDATPLHGPVGGHGNQLPSLLPSKGSTKGSAFEVVGPPNNRHSSRPNYSNSCWRSIKEVRARVANIDFVAEEGDGHWKRQFEQGFNSAR